MNSNQRTQRDLVDVAYRATANGIFAHFIVIPTVAVFLLDVASPRVVLPWAAAFMAVALWRLYCRTRFLKTAAAEVAAAARAWRRRLRVGMALTGIGWGAAIWLFYPNGSTALELMVPFILIGMSGGAAATAAGVRSAYPYFAFPALIPLAVRLVQQGEPAYIALAGMVLIFVVVTNRLAHRAHETLARSVSLGHENRQLLEEAERQRGMLETAVADRTKELRAERDRADAANRAKSDFLANVSHELRTPLNAIIGFSDSILIGIFGPLTNPRYKEYVTDIRNSGAVLLELINDLLDLSAIEVGQVGLAVENVDMAGVCGDSIRLLEDRARHGGVALSFDSDPGVGPVAGDRRRLNQIVVNLLTNAVKFTPAGGAVKLELRRGADDGTVLHVVDSGIGMSPEEIETALHPFMRGGRAYVRNIEGTGLGLPLANNLVIAHGGRLDIVSASGEGTAVTVSFPPVPAA